MRHIDDLTTLSIHSENIDDCVSMCIAHIALKHHTYRLLISYMLETSIEMCEQEINARTKNIIHSYLECSRAEILARIYRRHTPNVRYVPCTCVIILNLNWMIRAFFSPKICFRSGSNMNKISTEDLGKNRLSHLRQINSMHTHNLFDLMWTCLGCWMFIV